MSADVAELVLDLYSDLFESIFWSRFAPDIDNPTKRRDTKRRLEEASDAAAQSLIRLLANEQADLARASRIVDGLRPIGTRIPLERIANPNESPSGLANELTSYAPVPGGLEDGPDATLYRVSLHSVAQVLLLIGPVMAEWQRLRFSATYELPRRVVNRLNEISDRVGSGASAADRRYEEGYRDYLLSRFHQIDVGTVRMTAFGHVDLGELFVMPRLSVPKGTPGKEPDGTGCELLDLANARKALRRATPSDEHGHTDVQVLEQLRCHARNVIIGAPGSGKSTLLEWIQLKIAFVDIELVLQSEQAIPLLIRVRELDCERLPIGVDLIAAATGSRDRATLAPEGWVERNMAAGRMLVMLDGLDEIDPETRDCRLLPWFVSLCKEYPKCAYLVSSRPVGYPSGAFTEFGFAECVLRDFDESQVGEYATHWCTAVRLARNEPEEEARKEGEQDGKNIVRSFQSHEYIRDLARNPLMLSAICLVNYFERGRLPEDRAMLYGMCVEGLLHHWDSRRGIRSQFGLDEKMRVCRELAIAMQTRDRAESAADDVLTVFGSALSDDERARQLLEHIRFRSGLLVERRSGVFAFAHLTFQEFLAAHAIARGNDSGVTIRLLLQEEDLARWVEVLPLYCAITGPEFQRTLLRELLNNNSRVGSPPVLPEVFFACEAQIQRDSEFRRPVVTAINRGKSEWSAYLNRFDPSEVRDHAYEAVLEGLPYVSAGGTWLVEHFEALDAEPILQRLVRFPEFPVEHIDELVRVLHTCGTPQAVHTAAEIPGLYSSPATHIWGVQATLALVALCCRDDMETEEHVQKTLKRAVDTLTSLAKLPEVIPFAQSFAASKDAPQTSVWRRVHDVTSEIINFHEGRNTSHHAN